MKKLVVWMLTLMLCLTGIALAEGDVAQIGTIGYATFDAAVAAAKDGATITLLSDCTTNGLNLSKSLTVEGERHTLTFRDSGIALRGKTLTFKNCQVVMNKIGKTPDAEWNWMSICASKEAVLNLENTTMTMDGAGTGKTDKNTHAIYFCSNNKLNLTDSTLTIKNYSHDALEWDGGDEGYNITMKDSTFLSDGNRSGFTGTFFATIDNSKVDVVNSTGNGSNGSHFVIKNNSRVNFSDNAAHGLSAGILRVDNSTVIAQNNGANGVHAAAELTMTNGAKMTITGNRCSISSQWTIPGALYVNAQNNSKIDKTSTVTITGNKGSGLLLKSGRLEVAEGANLTIMQNTAEKLELGGGVHNSGTLLLNKNAKLYNNHAATAGDDIYNAQGAMVSFGAVGKNWALDGAPDCNDAIDGWYEDGAKTRWEAHAANGADNHIELTDAGKYEGALALKAAHGIRVSLPKTGDDSLPLLALMLTACLSMAAMAILTRRKQME